jgi:hypothetical protein
MFMVASRPAPIAIHRGFERLKLTCRFERGVLFGVGMLGRAHSLPGIVGRVSLLWGVQVWARRKPSTLTQV